MVKGRKLVFTSVFCNKEIDHVAVGGMYGDHSPATFHLIHKTDHLAVVDHQCAFISHESFEGSDSFFVDHPADFLTGRIVEVGDGHMKGIVAAGFAIRSSLPFAQSTVETLALCLQNKI